ncbi:substrate-binding domain-containing protein [Galbitalea soli]|uniref:Substrate-binding domain-containing protein n=1 Tax=Galbitalea soli TaxID=1268042 RepID=A0A7C9TR01_9MICO|nr:substrate-binding domain-containing protein [Galbitalea soli]NYJ29809.1 LacI family transcriptional regulator [Galbitalea soli]
MTTVGIRDVARLAGVSVTTVSHVLNETPHTRVADETRDRVRDAAATLGYGPNLVAQALRTRRSGLVGLLSEEIATTPHAGRIILGAQEAARAHGLTLVIVSAERGNNAEAHRADIQALLDRQVDAVLYATMYHRNIAVPANLVDVPAVLIDATEGTGALPSVVPDERGGAVAAVRHLAEAGHRRIAFLNNDDDVPATHGRLAGYRQVLSEYGIPFDELLVGASPSEPAEGYALAKEILSLQRPTAVFCYNDRMAMGAYRAARELGLSIPDDLSIVGFDNQEIIAANLFPALTTVALPHYEMGVWALETAIGMFADGAERPPGPFEPVLLPCPLVPRDSVAPPRQP